MIVKETRNGQADVRPTKVSHPIAAEGTIRLLHVEDNPADALLAQEFIRGVLPEVEFDAAARLADLTYERAAAADCAILDLSLPDATGLEALVALRQMSDDLPIIVLTGFDDLALGLAAVRDGADDYLIKNHVDSYTLERAVHYSIERRRLMRELITTAATATIATAAGIAADAATAAATEHAYDTGERLRDAEGPSSSVAPGTHEVSVRIDQETGDYTLACRSCTWVSESGSDDVHSWAARSLDAVLLRHVAIGDEATVAPAVAEPQLKTPASEPPRTPVSRRFALNMRHWGN